MKLRFPTIIIIIILFLIILAGAVSHLASSEDNSWKFAVICDTRNIDNNSDKNPDNDKSGINRSFLKNLSEEIVRQNCDLVLVPGDMINGWLPIHKFNWNNISEKNQTIYFLTNKSADFDWVRTAEIERIDNRTIKVSDKTDKKRSLSLRLNDNNTTVILEVDGRREDYFRAKTENGELNIYYNTTHTYATYKDQFENWKKVMDPVYKNNIDIYTVRGNHEDGPGNYSAKTHKEERPFITHPDKELLRAYNETLGKDNPRYGPPDELNLTPLGELNLTYSFPHKNAFFIGLDEYAKPHRVNQEWLDDQLKMNTKPFVFVFGHEPAFQVNHSDCLAYYSVNRSRFWDSLGRAGCQIYFCGHDHLYDRVHIPDSSGNIIYQMVISSGAPMKGWAPPYEDGSVIEDSRKNSSSGYVLVTMRDDNTAFVEWKEWNAKGSNWTQGDYFILRVKEDRGLPPIVWIILAGWPFVVLCLLLWRAEKNKMCEGQVWDELIKSSIKSGECGKFEDLVTAMIIWLAIPAVMAAIWVIWPIYHEKGMIAAHEAIPIGEGGTIVEGVTIFVIVYFVAQMIERIIEFISNIPIFEDNTNKMAKLKTEIDQMDLEIKELLKADPTANIDTKKDELDKLMYKQNCLESSRRTRLLAAASSLGIIFSYFFIGLFALVGIDSIPHWIDVLISGIILGGGSKPLHDLITSIERKAS